MNKTYLRRSPWACGQFDSLTNETSATKLKYYNWTWAELEYPMLGSKNGIIERHKYMVLGTMGLCDPNQFKTKARFFFFFFFSKTIWAKPILFKEANQAQKYILIYYGLINKTRLVYKGNPAGREGHKRHSI